MAVKLTIEIIREGENDTGTFFAFSGDASGSDVIFAGHGEDPYEALHDLIDEFENADLYKPDQLNTSMTRREFEEDNIY